MVREFHLLPTPGARDGNRGPRSDKAILDNSGQPSVIDIPKLLGLGLGLGRPLPLEEEGEEDVLLPTPRQADHKGSDSPGEWGRHSPGLAAVSFHFRDVPLLPTPRSTRGGSATETIVLLPTPVSTDASGTRNSTARRSNPDHKISLGDTLTDAMWKLAGVGGDRPVKLLPTPTTSDSRGAASGGAHDENVRVPRLAAAMEVDLPGEIAAAAAQPIPLLRTPNASDWQGQSGRPSRVGHQPSVGDQVVALARTGRTRVEVSLLPTPNARDSTGAKRPENMKAGFGPSLNDAAVFLLPTPNADVERGSRTPGAIAKRIARGDRQLSVEDAVIYHTSTKVPLLPTPSACNANDGEGAETWLARREVVKERVKNGNGMGMPLAIAVQLLPTPMATDGTAGPASNSPSVAAICDGSAGRNPRLSEMAAGGLLTDLADSKLPLLPTPVSQDGNGHLQSLEADIGNNGKSISIGDVVVRLPRGEGPLSDIPMLPTPQAFDSSNHVRTREVIDDHRYGLNGRTRGGCRNLREVVVNELPQ